MDRDEWRTRRDRVWKNRNRVITTLMLIAIVWVLARYFGPT